MPQNAGEGNASRRGVVGQFEIRSFKMLGLIKISLFQGGHYEFIESCRFSIYRQLMPFLDLFGNPKLGCNY